MFWVEVNRRLEFLRKELQVPQCLFIVDIAMLVSRTQKSFGDNKAETQGRHQVLAVRLKEPITLG